jgi:hypothetical protein
MLETVAVFLPLGLIAIWGVELLPKQNIMVLINKQLINLPENSFIRQHFLTQLKNEIEVSLFPRPTDSVLRRHYDALVAAELESRLAK